MLTILYIFLPGLTTSRAKADGETEYACILEDDVYFYKTESHGSGLFTLPKTYYVRVLSVGEPFTKVEYQTDGERTQTLSGYCLTEDLTFVDYTPVNPYLYATFEVIYRAENADHNDELLDKLSFTCAYYGDYYIGSKEYAYVLRDGEYTYVPKPSNFKYKENAEYEEWLSSNGGTSSANGSGDPIRIGVLAVLCLLVPLLAAILIKKTKPQTYDLDE